MEVTIVTSKTRVKMLLDGQLPDQPPLYDVIRNDAVIEYFGGETLTPENASTVVRRAHVTALDATKGFYKLPDFNAGQTTTRMRWTTWHEHRAYKSTEDYVRLKSEKTAEPWDWNEEDQRRLDNSIAKWVAMNEKSGDIVQDFGFPGPPRLDGIFTEVGLEAFSYYMSDCPDIIHRQIDYRFEKVVQAIEHSNLPPEAFVVSEVSDIAYKSGLLFSPDFLRKSFIPGYTRVCEAVHRKGRKVLFHSDGNLWEILDDLVSAGIDLLHPLEPLAGMDAGEVHRRYPHLILCGTIDVSQLLPFGTRQEIADQVLRNIEATEGKIMVGSSTEVQNGVPLENYLALHETVLDYAY